jgi:hypothetical protein
LKICVGKGKNCLPDSSPQPIASPQFNKLALISLTLTIVSLIVYVNFIDGASFVVFFVSTGFALMAGIVSFVLGVVARRQVKRLTPKPKHYRLVTVSIVVAVGYIFSMCIVAFNIIVYWFR